MQITFYLNNKKVQIFKPDPLQSLYEYLRQQRLFGARVSEGSGQFGTDIVTIASFVNGKVRYESIGALHFPLVRCHGKQVITVEGIGSRTLLHPIQQQFLNCESFQCGYCAGGYTMAMYSLLRTNPRPSEAQILQALDSNMCRCTGYNPVAAAVSAFASDIEDGFPICKERARFDMGTESVFPEELKALSQTISYDFVRAKPDNGETEFQVHYRQPETVDQLKKCYEESTYQNVVVASGASDHMMTSLCDITKNREYTLLSIRNVKEFRELKSAENFLEIGSQITYGELLEFVSQQKGENSKRIAQALTMFRNTAVRAIQTVGAGIHKKGDNDINLILAAMGATVELYDTGLFTFSTVNALDLLNQNMGNKHIISKIIVKKQPDFIFFTKRSRRHANMEALVGCCIVESADQLKIFVNNVSIGQVQIVTSGITKELFLACKDHVSMRNLVDIKFNTDDCEESRAYAGFKKLITANNLFLGQTKYKIDHNLEVDTEYAAALNLLESQIYGKGIKLPRAERIIPTSSKKIVGHPILQQDLKSKLLGEPIYSMDLDEFSNSMTHGAYVMTDRPFGKITKIDAEAAKLIPGFIAYVDERDIPNKVNGNTHSGIQFDTPVFVKNSVVLHQNQPIGLITATTRDAAIRAAKLVKVTYDTDDEEIKKSYIKQKLASVTLEDAIKNQSYHPKLGINDRVLTLGDPSAIEQADVIIEGENFMNGQEHMYFETHNCVVYPQEHGGMKVYSSTQNPSKMQFDIAWNLNCPDHKHGDEKFPHKSEDFIQNAQIEVEVMQVGGGFGGKQDRPMILCTAAAVASHVTKRPVKIALDRNQDIVTMGGRHPYFYKYKAGFDKEGKYVGLDLLLVSDGGSTYDCTGPVLDKSIFQCQSCYTIPNMKVEGRGARTNRVTNTAFRGFGAPQATFVQESIIDHGIQVWYDKFGKDKFASFQEAANFMRVLNINKPGDLMLTQTLVSTRYAEHLTQTLLKSLLARVDIQKKFAEVAAFNAQHKLIKRGVALTPLKNSINFEENFMNQGTALIHVYRDGSVALNHSGIEMGQSLHTKMAMVCAEALNIPIEFIRVINTSTTRCPNTQPTAASSGADINGKAVRMAAEEIAENLKELREKLKDKSWPELCNIAYFSRIRLTAQAFAVLPPEIEWHWPEKKGCTGFYTAYGVCLAVVEVNGMTGEYQMLEVYIQKDVGSPLNPLIDCGQIEGGFAQGAGLLTTEEIMWEGGNQFNKVGNYAIMSMADTPKFISTEIQKDVPNPQNIHDSKASAESPTCLGSAIYFALKNAVRELRVSAGKTTWNAEDARGNKYLKTSAPLSYRKVIEALE